MSPYDSVQNRGSDGSDGTLSWSLQKVRDIFGRDERKKDKQEGYKRTRTDTKYLIYWCERDSSCSGFADRQKAIVRQYLLAMITNRTFGIVMNEPAFLTDFYVPNLVNWDVKAAELAGKSSLQCDAKKMSQVAGNNCSDFNHFNEKYPQDVIYLRLRNPPVLSTTAKNGINKRLPKWAQGELLDVAPRGWVILMKPTKNLRKEVNSILVEIAKDMQRDEHLLPKLRREPCRTACTDIMDLDKSKFHSQSIDKCLKSLDFGNNVDSDEFVASLKFMCPLKKVFKPSSIENITATRDYDYVNLDLVCVQVRMGNGSDIKHEQPSTTWEDMPVIWKFIRRYIKKGHHVYLASDSRKLKDQGKKMFGSRLYINQEPIVHVNKVRKNQDPWLGMKTAITEQLLMATSCKILLTTKSGYGVMARSIRSLFIEGRSGFETYQFEHKDTDVTKIEMH